MVCSFTIHLSGVTYFYPYSKIPHLNTIQNRALEISVIWAPLNDTIIAFHDLMPPKEHDVSFDVYI